jgi:hypothetical protein
MNDLTTPSPAWEADFETHFSGSNALTTKRIRVLVARICAQNAFLKSTLKKRSQGMPYFKVLGVMKRDKIIKHLKRVAKGVPEVQELIVEFVQNQSAILGVGAMMVAPALAVREEALIEPEEDDDRRESMILRARSFEKILAEIGSTKSRWVDRYRQLRDEAQQREREPKVGGDRESDSELELEVLVIDEDGKRTWVESNSLASAVHKFGGASHEKEDGARELRDEMQGDSTGVKEKNPSAGSIYRPAR